MKKSIGRVAEKHFLNSATLVVFPASFYLQDPLCFPFCRVSYQNPAFDRVHHVIGPPLLIENTACSKMYLFFSFTHVRASRRGL